MKKTARNDAGIISGWAMYSTLPDLSQGIDKKWQDHPTSCRAILLMSKRTKKWWKRKNDLHSKAQRHEEMMENEMGKVVVDCAVRLHTEIENYGDIILNY